MGYLAAAGAYLIIGLVVSFILMVVGLFIGHIIVLTVSPSVLYPACAAITFSRYTLHYAC